MGGMFSTTNPSLFTNNNKNNIPDWMSNLDKVEIAQKESLDIDFSHKNDLFEKVENVATPRELIASYNDAKKVVDANIQLAKFLPYKYFDKGSIAIGNSINMKIALANIPGEFNFIYTIENGKIHNSNSFELSLNDEIAEYPFNKAGLKECLSDIKHNKVKSSKKVIAANPSFITLDEIIRRFNGSHRDALDAAKAFVQDGSIIGVNSNTYASIYNVDELFPQQDKEALEQTPEFEFIDNKEHVATNEYSSAKVLSLEASKVLAEFFPDFNIDLTSRDNNELLISANIKTDKGVTEQASFCFGIENNKIASLKFSEFRNERLTIEQLLKNINSKSNLLEAYLANNPKTAKHIYRGIVLTSKEIHRRLASIVNKDIVNELISNWCERKLLTPVNNTTFTTTASFEDLLSNVNTQILTKEEQLEIENYKKSFGTGFDREDVQDTGTRSDKELQVSNEIRLASLYNYLSKYIKNFNIKTANDNIELTFNAKNGLQKVCSLNVTYDDNNVKNVIAVINNVELSIDSLTKKLETRDILKAYIQDNKNYVVAKSIISSSKLKNILSDLIADKDIINAIKYLEKENMIKDIGNNNYASYTNINMMLNELPFDYIKEIKEDKLNKQARLQNMIDREDVQDTGNRKADLSVNEIQSLNLANTYLSKHFASFKHRSHKLNNNELEYTISLFDDKLGVNNCINLLLTFEKGRVSTANIKTKDGIVSLNEAKQLFASNEVLKKYLQFNNSKRVNSSIIFSYKQAEDKLKNITANIKETISNWEKAGKISKLASNAFVSDYTFEELLAFSNLKVLSESEILEKLNKQKRNKDKTVRASYEEDHGTRNVVDTWSSEKIINLAKTELAKHYKSFTILDINLDNDNIIVKANCLSDKLKRVKLTLTANKINRLDSRSNMPSISSESTHIDLNGASEYEAKNGKIGLDKNIIVSKLSLKNKLQGLVDVTKIDSIIDKLLESELLEKIDSDKYASKFAMYDLIDRINAFGFINKEAGKEQLEYGIRTEKIGNVTPVKDTGTRVAEKTVDTTLLKSKEQMLSNFDIAFNKKQITANKYNVFKEGTKKANTQYDLALIWKEFKKYI